MGNTVTVPTDPSTGSRLRGLLVGVLLVTAGAAVASAQEAGPERAVDIRRLEFEYKCFTTPGWEGKGEGEFLVRLRTQRDAYAVSKKEELARFEDLMAVALWRRAGFFRDKGDLETASRLADELKKLGSKTGEVARLRPDAARLVDSFSFKRAGEYEAQGNLPKALEHFLQCVDSTDAAIQKDSVAGVVRIVVAGSDLDRARASSDLAAEGLALQKVLADLDEKIPPGTWPAIQALRDRQTTIENSTGYLAISFLPAAGPLAAYKGPATALDLKTAEFRLVPVSEGQPWPAGGKPGKAPFAKSMLIRGTYDVEVYAPGRTDPVGIWRSFTVGKGDNPLEVPSRAPAGMVYLGPWQGGGGFFVDLTEVTNGQVKAAAAKDPGLEPLLGNLDGADDRPAWFPEDQDSAGQAQKFAASLGKRIPTLQQWLGAAYGVQGAARPYPWGSEDPDPAKHLVNGVTETLPVGSRPAGASPYGCLDMAGNVTEWVEVGGGLWGIGGNFQGELKAGGHDRLKEAAPGFSVYTGMSDADKNRYSSFKAPFEDYNATGLRLVIPVK